MSDTESRPAVPTTETENVSTVVERALDAVLGATVLAGEAAIRAAKSVKDDPAGVVNTWEERGRPLRERAADFLRDVVPPLSDSVSDVNESSPIPTEAAAPEIAPPVVSVSATTSTNGAMEELERRARMLEQHVTQTSNASDSPRLEAAPSTSEETPAEDATFVPETPYATLAESPYAVSETEDEQKKEELLMETGDTTEPHP